MNNIQLATIYNDTTVTVINLNNGEHLTFNITNGEEMFNNIIELIQDYGTRLISQEEYDDLKVMFNTRTYVQNVLADGTFGLGDHLYLTKDDQLYYRNGDVELEVPDELANRIIDMFRSGKSFEHLANFFNRLVGTNSFNTINSLFRFLTVNNLTLSKDGYFYAYKAVRSDFLDIYSGTISNAVGTVVTMPRAKVDDDQNQHCSRGLHVANYSYASSYGGGRNSIILLVKVDPADVVVVPNNEPEKVRCCRYEVVSVVKDNSVVESNYTYDEDYDEDYDLAYDEDYDDVSVENEDSDGVW